jgi:GTP-binding protein HflX
MFEVRDKPQMVESALLIGVYFDKREEEEAASLLVELEDLTNTLGIGIVDSVLVKVGKRHAKYLTGTGKARELIDYAKSLDCDCIIFDNELSPAQQRAWEADGNVCVIDRQEVILDIFSMRAQTKEARLQVQLARMQYSLPRLARMWAHLDRQGGGGGGGGAAAARGEGEKQIEVDRRMARKRIDRAKEELEQVREQRKTQRKERTRVPLPHASIVGYTNAGKSSLLNRVTDSDVLAEDKLFATLDTTTRRVELPDGQQLLLTDTVGFIRNLPHRLVESFKATLEEAVLADFLIHVLDASEPKVFKFYETTMEVLGELGINGKPMIVVLNKTDLVDDPIRLHELEIHFEDAVFISVKTGAGFVELTHRLNSMIVDRVVRLHLRVPQARTDLESLVHREGKTLATEYEGNDILLDCVVPKRLEAKFEGFVENETQAPSP